MDSHLSGQDEVVSQFCSMTGVPPSEARQYLDANAWDVEAAVTEFFAEQDEALQEEDLQGEQRLGGDDQPGRASAGRTLGGSFVPSSATTPQPSASAGQKSGAPKRFATLGDYQSGGRGPADARDHDDDSPQDFFAGGEKSGLAVQNPNDIKRKIIEKAQREQPPPYEDRESRRSFFTGTARTLGGEDAPSRVIETPSAPVSQQPTIVRRTLHFWTDGFSVDDGDLYRADDPRNAEILEGIRQGRAPLSIMNVEPGCEVDVDIKQHNEKYVKPKPKYKPFSGQGQRLGSPTPAIRNQATAPANPTPQPSTETAEPTVDETQPLVTLQVRLGDGTRLSSRFNTTHTIGDVYDFVSAASPASRQRPWVLMTTFPSKELSDKSVALGDLADFKRGGVVVQKWQ